MKKALLFILLLTATACVGAQAETYTYVDLISRLTDLHALAVLPAQGETCSQWSSYDRASRYDAASGKYVGWDANGDGGGVIREEGSQVVMAEMEGPGCIWRIWSAAPKDGHVRIYLDGAAEPVVDLPFYAYFDHSSAPFTYRSLVHDSASGKNCYVPIPYQKSCKITADKNWGAYFQFVYTAFPQGTVVPTFKRNLTADERLALKKADYLLSSKRGEDPAGKRVGAGSFVSALKLGPRSSSRTTLQGSGAITGLKMKGDAAGFSQEELRNTILRIYWDGESEPSVCSPIGDFFGTGPGANLYRSLPMGVTDDGFYSYWYMPYANGAVIEIANEGSEPFQGDIEVFTAPLVRPAASLGRFHAKWHRNASAPGEPERAAIDWTMLKTEGRGRFCGVALEVWNPRGGWWGEGDEKFFVDGEKFPSTIGTGSEDYFGYAWCNPGLFQNCYHNQTRNDGSNVGHVSVNRWHIADNIPFQKSFEGAIEKYYDDKRPTLYASTVYWYLAPGGTDPYGAVPAADRTFYAEVERYRVKGALEGEKLKVLEKTGGTVSHQELSMYGGKWSDDTHLWWTQAKPGDKLVFRLPVESAGTYDVRAQLTKAADYGIVRFSLDGKTLGDAIDLYNNGVVATGELSLGTLELTQGDHQLAAEIVGTNPNATPSYMMGLDYIRLAPAK